MTKKAKRKALITRSKAGVTITPAGRALIEAMSAEGNDQRTLARALGIGQSTLVRCKERDEAVKDAWADGHALLADELTHILLGHARGDGKASVIAAIYLTKARLGWTDQPQPEERAPNVIINLPESRSPEEHMKLLEFQQVEQLPETQKSDAFGLIPAGAKVIR